MPLFHLDSQATFGGEYRILRPIKIGTRSAVYEAEHLQTGQPLCLKLLHPGLVSTPEDRHRFEAQARLGGLLRSEHFVKVRASGVDLASGVPWLAMELLQGEPLEARLRHGPELSAGEARGLLSQLCAALGELHERGLVHAHLKPKNLVLLRDPPGLKILDLGIGRLMSEARLDDGAALGSPMWMAPEQSGSAPALSPATDVWTIGLIGFRLLAGHAYWREANRRTPALMSVLREVTVDPIEPASQRAAEYGCGEPLPPGFDAWFARCVDRNPVARFRTAGEAGGALEGLDRQRPALAPPNDRSVSPGDGTSPRTALSQSPTLIGGGSIALVQRGDQVPSAASRPQRRSGGAGQAAPRRRWPWVAATLVLLSVASAYTYRRLQPLAAAARWQRECEQYTGDGFDGRLRRQTACLRACDGGSAQHCAALGDTLLGSHAVGEADAREALRAYQRACAGLPSACSRLAQLYADGVPGVPADRARALDLHRQACAGGQAVSCAAAAGMLARGEGQPRDPAGAAGLWQRACERGHAPSCTSLGLLYLSKDVRIDSAQRSGAQSIDEQRATALFTSACDHGDQEGCGQLGALMLRGPGGPREADRAVALLRGSCDGGSATGCLRLGLAYRDGVRVARDEVRAAALLHQGCTAQEAQACYALAGLYQEGRGVGKDKAQAQGLLRRACEGGYHEACAAPEQTDQRPRKEDPRETAGRLVKGCNADHLPSCYRLAQLLFQGQGISRDQQRSLRMLHEMCDHGYQEACKGLKDLAGQPDPRGAQPGILPRKGEDRGQVTCATPADCFRLGDFYSDGAAGVPRSLDLAAQFMQRACKLGNADGCLRLGQMYQRGQGVPKNAQRGQELVEEGCAHGSRQPECERLPPPAPLPFPPTVSGPPQRLDL